MHRILLLIVIGGLPLLQGCSGGAAPPSPEEPINEQIKAVNDFAGHLEELDKQAKSGNPKDIDKALDKAADALDKMETTLTDIAEKIKRTPMTAAERRLYNSVERRKELEKAQERIGRIVGPVADLLQRKDLNPGSIRRFQQAWEKLRSRADVLDKELEKWASQ